MSEEKTSFLKKKNVIISFKRYAIDALGAMALGLFASLLMGTILSTIGQNVAVGSYVSNKLIEIGGYASAVTGPAMAVSIGYALQAPPLVLYSLAAVGGAAIANGGSGGPLTVLFVAIIACEFGKLVSKETQIDILVTPFVTIMIGAIASMLLGPVFGALCNALGTFIGWATNLQPLLMGIIVASVMGIALTLPISSAAVCAAIGISGGAVLEGLAAGSVSVGVWNGLALAGGAATVGCCCQMLGFAILSYPENGVGGFVAQGLGTSMLQVPNLMKKPVLWLPVVLSSAILGPIATCIFHLRNNGAAISSGMGTSGMVGPIGVITGWTNMPEGYTVGVVDWIGMILCCIVLPLVLTWAIGKVMRAKGIIKPGDLKIDLG